MYRSVQRELDTVGQGYEAFVTYRRGSGIDNLPIAFHVLRGDGKGLGKEVKKKTEARRRATNSEQGAGG